MLLGAGTTHKLELITSAAADIEVSGSKVVVSQATPPVVDGSNTGAFVLASITSAVTQALVSGIASTTTRIDELQARNNHATVACDLTFQRTNGTDTSTCYKVTLLPGESVSYAGGVWTHYDVNGGVYLATPKLDARLRVATDVTNATTSFADVTGLTCALKAGKAYCFEAHIFSVNNATTTGSQFGVNIGAAPTALQLTNIGVVTPSVTAAALSAGQATARDTAVTAQTTGSASVRLEILSGYIVPSADGTFAIRCASEVAVAAGLVVKAGSWLRIWEADN